jgi:hypothetical protein
LGNADKEDFEDRTDGERDKMKRDKILFILTIWASSAFPDVC